MNSYRDGGGCASNTGLTTKPVERVSELVNVTDRLREEVKALCESWSTLQFRLETVTRKEPESDGKAECRPTPCTEASVKLDIEVVIVSSVRKQIVKLTTLLEV